MLTTERPLQVTISYFTRYLQHLFLLEVYLYIYPANHPHFAQNEQREHPYMVACPPRALSLPYNTHSPPPYTTHLPLPYTTHQPPHYTTHLPHPTTYPPLPYSTHYPHPIPPLPPPYTTPYPHPIPPTYPYPIPSTYPYPIL